MDLARRIYVYTASLVGLSVFAIGATRLLSTVIVELLGGRGRLLVESGAPSDLSLAIALVVTGLPVWLIHWGLAQRWLRGPDEAVVGERRSTVRATYVTAVGLAALGAALISAVSVISGAIRLAAGAEVGSRVERGDAVALLIVSAAVWLIHARERATGLRRARLNGAAAWLPRLARYVGAGLGLAVALVGAGGVTSILLDSLDGDAVLGSGSLWTAQALAGPAAMIVAGLLAWWLHWREAEATIRDRVRLGEDERGTRLRALYLGIVLLAAAVAAVGGIMAAVYVSLSGGVLAVLARPAELVEPLLLALPTVLAGVLHVRRQLADADGLHVEAGDDLLRGRSATFRDDALRRATLTVAFVGLVVVAVGTTWMITLGLEEVFGTAGSILSASSGHDLATRAAGPIAAVLAGAVLWAPSWTMALRRRSGRPTAEARSTSWSVYLYLVLLGAVVVAVPDAAILLYRAIDQVLRGAAAGPLLPDQAGPVAALLVALAAAGYHASLLGGDRRRLRVGGSGAATGGSLEAAGPGPAFSGRPVPAAGRAPQPRHDP